MEKDTKVVDETNIESTPVETTEENNAVEETKEKKSNIVAEFFSGVWYNFIDSFKYNHCKLPGILIALPGLFIGFFLVFHSKIKFFTEPDLSGFYMFILVLFGCINIFNGVTVMTKKNLGSIIVSAICTLVIVVFGILWIYSIFYSYHLASDLILEDKYVLSVNHYMSIICVALSIICSVVGCILAYFNRDKNYKKVKF